jgi:hypothetical protein
MTPAALRPPRSFMLITMVFPAALRLRLAGAAAAGISLVKLNLASQHFKAIGLLHENANSMANTPSSFISNSKGSLQLLAAYAVAGSNKKIDSIKPGLQWCPAILENRICARIEMTAARGAAIGAPL